LREIRPDAIIGFVPQGNATYKIRLERRRRGPVSGKWEASKE
jgi:hypothetical protein